MKSEQVHKEPYLCNRHRSGVGLSAAGGERERERESALQSGVLRLLERSRYTLVYAMRTRVYQISVSLRESSGNLRGVSDLFRFWHAARARTDESRRSRRDARAAR